MQKRQSGRTALRWSSLFFLAPHLGRLRRWVPPPWPPRRKRASPASPAASLRAPPLWRPDSCCTPWAGKKKKEKKVFSRVFRQQKWWRAIHTFKPVSVLWAQVLLLSMATSWLPSKSFRVTLCWFYFTFVCSLFWHNNLLFRLRINREARRNMVTDKHREDYRQPWLPR